MAKRSEAKDESKRDSARAVEREREWKSEIETAVARIVQINGKQWQSSSRSVTKTSRKWVKWSEK